MMYGSAHGSKSIPSPWRVRRTFNSIIANSVPAFRRWERKVRFLPMTAVVLARWVPTDAKLVAGDRNSCKSHYQKQVTANKEIACRRLRKRPLTIRFEVSARATAGFSNQLEKSRTTDFRAVHPAVLGHQAWKSCCRNSYSEARRSRCKVLANQQIHFRIVLLLGMRVGVATARMSAKVAIKPGADVPEFVEDGDQFLPKRQVHEPRQIEGQDVEDLASLTIIQRWIV